MKAKRFSEEQIVGVLKEAEAGAKTKDLCRRIQEAHLPKVKTLEEFEFQIAPHISAALIRNLAEGWLPQPQRNRSSCWVKREPGRRTWRRVWR